MIQRAVFDRAKPEGQPPHEERPTADPSCDAVRGCGMMRWPVSAGDVVRPAWGADAGVR